MDKQIVELIVLGMFAAVGACYIMHWAREYLQAFLRRQRGESLLETVQRAEHEKSLNRLAKAMMLGSRKATVASLVINVGFAYLLFQTMLKPWLFWTLVAYDGVGFWLTRHAGLERLPHWRRLTWSDRIWARWTHANLWPVHLFLRGLK